MVAGPHSLALGQQLPADVGGFAYGGNAGETCGACTGFTVDTTRAWYAIEISQDLNPGGALTRVIVTSDTPSPLRLNEGE